MAHERDYRNTFKSGDMIKVAGRSGEFTVKYIDGPWVYYSGGEASRSANSDYGDCTLVPQPKFKAGDIVKNSNPGEHVIKCVKTHYGSDLGGKFTGPIAYDYTEPNSWDYESSLTLVRSAVTAATAAPKFKVGDRVKNTNVPEAGTGIVTELTKNGGVTVNFSNTWYGVCGDNERYLVLVTPAIPALTPTIVVRKDGTRYRPNDNPRVHDTAESAQAEAERLAKANPGVEFATFVLASTSTATAPTVTTVAA